MKHILLFCICIAFALTGCATKPHPDVTNPAEAYYHQDPVPPAGLSRVYILPAVDDKNDIPGDLYVGASEDTKALLSSIKKNEFVAFDTKPGTVFIDFEPLDYSYFNEAKSFTIQSHQTLVLRPMAHFSGNLVVPLSGGGDAAAAGAVIDLALLPVSGAARLFTTRTPEFEVLDLNSALDDIRSRKLSSIAPGNPSLSVKQAIP